MTPNRRGSAIIEFPNELEILLTREFDAPIALVFDVLTKPEHVRKHFAPFGEEVTVCSIDLRVGGDYHIVMVTDDGTECSFRGTYLEVEPPTRTVQTWLFDGWPGVEAVESMDLHETHGVTTLTHRLAFRDKAGRDHMTKYDGLEASFDNVEEYLRSLLDPKGAVSGS
ncbi:MAG: SRPBCC domain-containing protein [Chloroflexi bacterium]|nr:SRPBCC domain-containing protein [Chloroflexota bacterium]